MNASKENAQHAFDLVVKSGLAARTQFFLKEFLAAAMRKLPSEASYTRA